MALTNTQTNGFYHNSFKGDPVTPIKVQFLQTAGSAATAGGVEVFADGTAADDFFLTSIDVSFLAPTANAVFTLYANLTKIATYPTLAADTPAFYHHSWPNGINVGEDITTATVHFFGDGANTATVQFIATGFRKI